jgi:hypothetical protein
LRAVERLNLALFVYAQYQSVIGRVHIQALYLAYNSPIALLRATCMEQIGFRREAEPQPEALLFAA